MVLIEVSLRSVYNAVMKEVQFANEHIYHIYNRGVEKRNIFMNHSDYLRFVANLYEFNDRAPAFNFGRQLSKSLIEVRLQSPRKDPLVNILAFCLMPNHYHLMMQQREDNGITEFMRKLGTGYTNYFNLKYDRVGALFQGKFKAVLLEREAHFQHLPHYIHLNPLDLKMPEWRNGNVKNTRKAIAFLKKYRWSSLPDYLGLKNFPSVTEREFLTECVGEPRIFLSRMQEWISEINFDFIQNVVLEEI